MSRRDPEPKPLPAPDPDDDELDPAFDFDDDDDRTSLDELGDEAWPDDAPIDEPDADPTESVRLAPFGDDGLDDVGFEDDDDLDGFDPLDDHMLALREPVTPPEDDDELDLVLSWKTQVTFPDGRALDALLDPTAAGSVWIGGPTGAEGAPTAIHFAGQDIVVNLPSSDGAPEHLRLGRDVLADRVLVRSS